MSRLAERVRELWSTNPSEQRALMRTLQGEGYKPGEILREIQVLRSGGQRTPSGGRGVDESLLDCQRDDEGRVVDPFTLKTITAEHLVSYISERGGRFCFDRRSLYRQYVLGDYQSLTNPFTREELPLSLQEEVIQYGEGLRTVITIGGMRLVVEPFTMIGELAVQYFTSLGPDYLSRLTTTNLLYADHALYSERLTADVSLINGPITTRPFANLVEKSEVLILFFEFVRKLRARPLYETIYLHLGQALAMVPIVAKEDGFDLQLTADMTVLEVTKEFYRALAEKFGKNVYREYNIVTEHGESLSDLDWDELISAQIPGEKLYYVVYRDDVEASSVINDYLYEAFYENDRHWLDEINAGQDYPQVPHLGEREINYTAQELSEYIITAIEEGELTTRRPEIENAVEDLIYKRVSNSLVYPVLLKAIELNSFPDLLALLDVFELMYKFKSDDALRKYDLSTMQRNMRQFIAESIADKEGAAVVDAFYENGQFRPKDFTLLPQLDDVRIFHAMFEHLIEKDSALKLLLRMVLSSKGPKLPAYIKEQVEARYSWTLLLGVLDGEQYRRLLDKVHTDLIEAKLRELDWLEELSSTEHFVACFRVFLARLERDALLRANWKSCAFIFEDEAVVRALPEHFIICRKVAARKAKLVVNFLPYLTAEEVNWIIWSYPSAIARETALRLGYEVKWSALDKDNQKWLALKAVTGDYPLLLAEVKRAQQNPNVAIILATELPSAIEREQASAFIGGSSYEETVPLLRKHFLEQIDFDVLPVEYFRRHLRSLSSEGRKRLLAVLTPEQKRRIGF